MKRFLQWIADRISCFMDGRYGCDGLSVFLSVSFGRDGRLWIYSAGWHDAEGVVCRGFHSCSVCNLSMFFTGQIKAESPVGFLQQRDRRNQL